MEKYFVLLGGNKLLHGQVVKLHEFGYKVIVIAWNDNPDIVGDMFIQLDVKDAVSIIEKLEQLGLKNKIYGALSSIDLAVPTVNAINGWCGNKTMPDKFNTVLTKEEMRNAWMSAGVFNRISKIDDQISINEILNYSQRMKLICKPNVAASSRGITIIERGQTKEFLEKAIIKAKNMSFDNKCLIEEFVEGEEFTVDMLGDSYGNINCYGSSIQYHSKYALNNHVTVIHHWNSNKYDDGTWERIANFGIQCYKALGLSSMFGHLEIIMKEDGSFTPIEMGARSSGFICSHTVWKASGHDYLGDYINMLHGGKIENGNYMNGKNSSMWFGYDIPSNTDSVKETDITKFLYPYVVLTNDPTPPSDMCIGPIIGDFSQVATSSILLPGVIVGKNCLIGARSIVAKNVDDYQLVVGSPSKVLKDVREIKDRETGETHYPWPYRFTRGMPWEKMGFKNWNDEQNADNKKDIMKRELTIYRFILCQHNNLNVA